MKNPRREAGLALAEVLIAAVIIAAGGALLVGGLAGANRSADLRVERAVATQLLASEIALLPEAVGGATPTAGTFPPPLADYDWTLDHVPSQTMAPLEELTLTVSRQGRRIHAVSARPLESP
jgi:hypothetical protein